MMFNTTSAGETLPPCHNNSFRQQRSRVSTLRAPRVVLFLSSFPHSIALFEALTPIIMFHIMLYTSHTYVLPFHPTPWGRPYQCETSFTECAWGSETEEEIWWRYDGKGKSFPSEELLPVMPQLRSTDEWKWKYKEKNWCKTGKLTSALLPPQGELG